MSQQEMARTWMALAVGLAAVHSAVSLYLLSMPLPVWSAATIVVIALAVLASLPRFDVSGFAVPVLCAWLLLRVVGLSLKALLPRGDVASGLPGWATIYNSALAVSALVLLGASVWAVLALRGSKVFGWSLFGLALIVVVPLIGLVVTYGSWDWSMFSLLGSVALTISLSILPAFVGIVVGRTLLRGTRGRVGTAQSESS